MVRVGSAKRVGIQSPIPLIYLLGTGNMEDACWDSVTYPLDILEPSVQVVVAGLGFSHLSP